jgi:hypothetical protein
MIASVGVTNGQRIVLLKNATVADLSLNDKKAQLRACDRWPTNMATKQYQQLKPMKSIQSQMKAGGK